MFESIRELVQLASYTPEVRGVASVQATLARLQVPLFLHPVDPKMDFLSGADAAFYVLH